MRKLENLSDEELAKELKRRVKIENRVVLFLGSFSFILAFVGLVLSIISISC